MFKSFAVISAFVSLSFAQAGEIDSNTVIETYAENELVISQIWTELAPEGTMRDAVQKWQEMGQPALKFNCVAFDPCAHVEHVAGGIAACIRNVDLVVSSQTIKATVNFRPENPALRIFIAPRILGADLLEGFVATSERISATWDGGEQSLDLKSSQSDEGTRRFVANLATDPQGASGLTLDQDLNFGLECTPSGYSIIK
jgi:hypothetical protein